jgi:hypothetical protein
MVTLPVRVPNDSGANVTLIVHVAPGATVAPQVWAWANSPSIVMLEIVSVPAPEFRTMVV